MMYGDEVNAKARPRSLSDEVSEVITSTLKIMPTKPME